ncbi:lysyl-tRNA synthetase, putative [Babesia bigemina]|uniref:Lysyl-tRNA synthetase n=1 Tax=Babesia bigemina TaxID=5866 RepID=A0A061D4G4_BABBI|nr:lysyl-tRNA synthetase, putative [Babesia bigemina]CDR94942.1 lysyl-tRNA synthetase, putative [Babesia bigemina]|eukprot:XP_012767128.1 lysyl-tRNA synthetase, putative [Babesia bigemina]
MAFATPGRICGTRTRCEGSARPVDILGVPSRLYASDPVGPATSTATEHAVNPTSSAERAATLPNGSADDGSGYDAEALAAAFTHGASAPMLRQISSRLAKMRTIKGDLRVDPYPEVSEESARTVVDVGRIAAAHADLGDGEEVESIKYRVRGRIKSIRFDGLFVVIEDVKGHGLQVMFRRHQDIAVGGASFSANRVGDVLDIGDIILVEGHPKRTATGEMTLVAHSLGVLAKCLLPMPDGFHGLKDVDTRQRLRHLDIMTSAETKRLLQQRSHMVWMLRQFLHGRGYVEVETPVLYHGYSGAQATPFVTRSEALDQRLYLRIAPELFLKRLVTAGLADRVFEIGKCFRNEGTSTHHSPEFTMLELYQQMAGMGDMMRMTEEIVATVATGLRVAVPKFTTKSMSALIEEHAGVKVEQCSSEQLVAALAERGVDETALHDTTWGGLVCALFKHAVEGKILEPTHVTALPADSSPLAAVDADGVHGRVFESYLGGLEFAHGCTEECDPVKLLRKLDRCRQEGLSSSRDTEFLNAVAYGMPPTAGLGIGIDRLLMALTGATSIKHTQTFPLLKNVE